MFISSFNGQSSGVNSASNASVVIPADATYVLLKVSARGSDANTAFTSMTLGGISFTYNPSTMRRFNGSFGAVAFGYMLAADMPSGTVTASVTRSGTSNGLAFTIEFYKDVLQQAPDVIASSANNATSISTNITTLAANALVTDAVQTAGAAFNYTQDGGQTLIDRVNVTGQNNGLLSSYKQVSSPGTTSSGWTSSDATARDHAQIVLSLAPSTSAPIISTGTPTGTTTPTPTLGFATDTNSGTARFVVDSAANLSGVTAAQVLAGQKASGAAAAYLSNTITVSSTSVSGSLTASLPAGTYTAAAAQNDGTNNSNVLTWTFTVAAPDITSISDTTPYPGQSITLGGTGFEASQGTGSVKINGVTQTITAWSDTSITFTAVLGTNKYGTSYNIVVQNNTGDSSSGDTVTMVTAAGYAYVDVGTPNTTAANRITAAGDIASGDQIEYEADGDVTVYADGTFEIASGATYPYSFDVRVWTTGDGWGSSATQPVDNHDVVTPYVESATADTNGTTITMVFSEAVEAGAGGAGGMTITPLSLSGIALTYASGDGTDTWTFTAASTIYKNRPLELSFAQPGDGIQDLVGNELSSFSEFTATNNSTQNQAPTDIALSNNTVPVTGGLNAAVGTLSATDADYGETFAFTLVAGTGSTNNASFSISGTTLRCNDPEALGVGSYSVRVQVADGSGGVYAKAFTLSLYSIIPASGGGSGFDWNWSFDLI